MILALTKALSLGATISTAAHAESERDQKEQRRLTFLRDRLRPLVEAAVCEYLPSPDGKRNQAVVEYVNQHGGSQQLSTVAFELSDFFHEQQSEEAEARRIEERAKALLQDTRLEDVYCLLRKKYGTAPKGWVVKLGIHREVGRCISHLLKVSAEQDHVAFLALRLLRMITTHCGRFCAEQVLGESVLGNGPVMQLWRKHRERVCRINMEITDEIRAVIFESCNQYRSQLHLFPSLTAAYEEMVSGISETEFDGCTLKAELDAGARPSTSSLAAAEGALLQCYYGSQANNGISSDIELSVIRPPPKGSLSPSPIELAAEELQHAGMVELDLESDFELEFDALARRRAAAGY